METDLVNKTERDADELDKRSETGIDENGIAVALELTGHITADYPNGITSGVKLEGVPGTRGVHIDVVFVLDLRKAVFGKGGLAMRAAVLETVNRDLEKVMSDVGLSEYLHEYNVLTPWGRVRLPLLRGMAHGSLSLMHETRTVYVITQNAKPTFDLSWLTEASRIVTADQFSLIRQSDARSKLPDLKKNVQIGKWQLLETGLLKGWFGVLALGSLAIGLSTSIAVLAAGSGSILIPAIVSGASGVLGGLLLRSSRSSVTSFQETLVQEHEQLRKIGDSARISESILENEDRLQLIADLNFVVSPLLATVGNAINSNDVDAAVNIACSVLDECVRLAPKAAEASSVIRGDEGLRMFIGLFEHLGGNIEETKLALAYVGLTGHITKRITFGEAVSHVTELVNSLYDIGALRPNIKEILDDRLNMIALKEAVEEIDKEMQSEEEHTLKTEAISIRPTDAEQRNPEQPSSFDNTDRLACDLDLHKQILHASAEPPQPDDSNNLENLSITESGSSDDIAIVGADIVKGSMKKQKSRPKEPAQLVLDDFEYIRSSGESKTGRESAGV
jgi:hypothetical protein